MKEQHEGKRQCEALWSIDLATHTRTWKEETPKDQSLHFVLQNSIQVNKAFANKGDGRRAGFTCSGLNKQMWYLWAD